MDLDPVFRHIAVMAAGDTSAVQNDRYLLAFRNIRRAADDLQDVTADVDGADMEMIRIRVRLAREHLADHDLRKVFVKFRIAFHLGPGKRHGVGVLLCRDAKIRNVLSDPR